MDIDIVYIFYHLDEFCKLYNKQLIPGPIKKRNKVSRLSMSEIMTICIYFHYSGYKTFKDYYLWHVCQHMQNDFGNRLVSYNRFIELRQQVSAPLMMFTQACLSSCSGISIIDGTPLKVCHPRRQYSHKVFKGTAAKGKSSTGWFFGFKLHLVINDKCEIVAFSLTPGNIADNNRAVLTKFAKSLFGKLFGDRGYIGASKYLLEKGIEMVHRLRKNMKNKLMNLYDKLLLKKRGIIETVIGILKEQFSLEHTRHRSPRGFIAHIASTIIAYAFRPKKPSLGLNKACRI